MPSKRSPSKRSPSKRPYDAMLLRDIVQSFLKYNPDFGEDNTVQQLVERAALETVIQSRKERRRRSTSPMPAFEHL